jgi:hypothetical protein
LTGLSSTVVVSYFFGCELALVRRSLSCAARIAGKT